MTQLNHRSRAKTVVLENFLQSSKISIQITVEITYKLLYLEQKFLIDGYTDRVDGGDDSIDNGKNRDNISSITANNISKLGEDDAHHDHGGPCELEAGHLPLEDELVDASRHNRSEAAEDDPDRGRDQNQSS